MRHHLASGRVTTRSSIFRLLLRGPRRPHREVGSRRRHHHHSRRHRRRRCPCTRRRRMSHLVHRLRRLPLLTTSKRSLASHSYQSGRCTHCLLRRRLHPRQRHLSLWRRGRSPVVQQSPRSRRRSGRPRARGSPPRPKTRLAASASTHVRTASARTTGTTI